MYIPSFASLYAYEKLVTEIAVHPRFASRIQEEVVEIEETERRLVLSDHILGLSREFVSDLRWVLYQYSAEKAVYQLSSIYIEENLLLIPSLDLRIPLSVEDWDEKQKKMQAAYLVRWGVWIQERRGEWFKVIETMGEDYVTNGQTCDCKVRNRVCPHRALLSEYQKNRNKFEFLRK
ncbi:hypothetical protein ACQ4M3_19070 [Leptolyngbya sp. AN03gr2]|uniref:hypothetical protein n=1 Tax=Leptolyngbya sp. AN03gr2 TaxID=3423364 RepID=UPI003D31B556